MGDIQFPAPCLKAVDNILDKATSPTGLIASFVLGASTQLDITRKVRKNLLNGASRDVLSFLMTQVSVYMANSTPKTSTSLENMTSGGEDKTPSSEDDNTSPAAPFIVQKETDT